MSSRFYSAFALTLLTSSLFAAEEEKTKCDVGPVWWYEMRHKEAGGIGYEDGYTTGAVFLSPKWDYPYQPFVDFRLNVFNNGKWDTNAGIGFRHLTDLWGIAYGFNGYFDWRDTKEIASVFQLGAGFELFSRYVDFRLNGYGPVGNGKGSECPEFSHFCGNMAFGGQELFAVLPHIDGEIGFPIRKLGPVDLYFALGSYYLFERRVEGVKLGEAWGGKARLEIDFYDALFIGGSVSYDDIFEVRPQGYIGFSLPLGPRNLRQGGRRFAKKFPDPCMKRAEQVAMLTQRVEREEVIPLQKKTEHFQLLPSGLSCRILFVDGCRGGNEGTFESPFQTLAQAEAESFTGDIIYVFPGDGPLQGITLQNDQRLIGSAASFTLCDMCVPAQTPCAFPTIASGTASDIVLANNNEVAGFILLGPTGGPTPVAIDVQNAGDFYLHDLSIQGLSSGVAIGSLGAVTTPAGAKTIANLSIQNKDSSSMAIDLISQAGSIDLSGLQIEGEGGLVSLEMEGFGEISIANSTFSSLVEVMTLADGTDVSVRHNSFVGLSYLDTALLFQLGGGRAPVCVESNSGEGVFVLDVLSGVTAEEPICLRLAENCLSSYELNNQGENLALIVESADGTFEGVDDLNKSGSTTALTGSADIGFVCPGECVCCP